MKVWQIHSGPYDDDEGNWWLVAKAEYDDTTMNDIEIMFGDMEAAIKFKNTVDLAWDPVEIGEGV